ncbi:MAG: tol-pal system protein YbgF [Dokdonella sp.]
MLTVSTVVRNTAVAAFVAVAVFASSAQAQQRLSLAERVAALENKASGQSAAQGNIELLNQIQALQSQLATLQGRTEELQHQLDELKRTSTSQYVDLDSRIGRIEGGGMTAPPSVSANVAPAADPSLPDVSLGDSSTVSADRPLDRTIPRNDEVPARTDPGLTDTRPGAADGTGGGDPVAEKIAYDSAFSALKDGRYAESARRFQAFVGEHPQSELASNAYYWLGESYYAAENFGVAKETFETLLTRFPNSAKASDALLKIGYCQYETKQWDAAEATLNDVVSRYPNSQAARLAQGRLRALKLDARR